MVLWRDLILLIVLLPVTHAVFSSTRRLKVCADEDYLTVTKCRQLELGKKVSCVYVPDSVNCALRLQSGEVDVGTFSAEQLYLISSTMNESVAVIEEIRNLNRPNDNYEFKTVVVAHKNFNHVYRGAKYCNFGWANSSTWTLRVVKKFENFVLKNLKKNITSRNVEDELTGLEGAFGPSCRFGRWVADQMYNDELHEKFKKLRAICERPGDNLHHENVFDCLINGEGDIAYVDFDQLQEYFKQNVGHLVLEDYVFLCPNGSKILATEMPCPWITQPLPAIVARRSQKDRIYNELTEQLELVRGQVNNSLKYILKISNNSQEYPLPSVKFGYVREARDSPESLIASSVRWCVISDLELEKCGWLQRAVLTAGISPELRCVQSDTVFDCFDKIHHNLADVMSSDANYGYIARTVYNLTSIAYPETEDRARILAVVKENSTTKFKTFEDLKSTKACYPEYNGIAWRAVLRHAQQFPDLLVNDSLALYFSEMCAPGANDTSHGISAETHVEQLCALCPLLQKGEGTKICTSNVENLFYGNEGAMDCLNSGGDVAFVEKQHLKDLTGNYRVLCRNNSLANFTGLRVDDDCALTVTINSEIVTRTNATDNRNIRVFLDEIEHWFGVNRYDPRATMNVFANFRGHRNVLFKDGTTGFRFGDTDDQYYINFNNLIYDGGALERVGELSAGYYLLIFGSIVVILGMMGFVIYNVVMKSEYHRANRAEF